MGPDGRRRFRPHAEPEARVGYRYLNYGSIATGGSSCLAGGSGGTSSTANCSAGVANTISSRNRLASNDFRLGLIYLIGGDASLPVVAQ